MSKTTIFFMIIIFSLQLLGVEKIKIKQTNRMDFLEKIEAHNVFPVGTIQVDIDESNNFYLLNSKYGDIWKIDQSTGKLLKKISNFGQGPGELNIPISFRVKNGIIFVSDFGFGGIKIFDLEGKLINEFRTHPAVGWLDVTDKNEIYVREADKDATPIIAIYDINGNRIKTFVRFRVGGKGDKIAHVENKFNEFRVVQHGNVVVLFRLKALLQKYGHDGNLLWERKIENELVDKYASKQKPRYGIEGTVHFKIYVSGFNVDNKGMILVGQVGGACLFNSNGELIKLVSIEGDTSLSRFTFFGNDKKLINIHAGGKVIDIYENIITGGD